jgi:AcrR family transcriptional regulator
MRTKDDEKRTALFEATVKLVNAIGFAASSVSKIAREAGVSPATLYVYYQNKEHLLVSTYIDIKQDMSRALLEGFDPDRPIRDSFQKVWFNMFAYTSDNSKYFQYAEQFANSPYSLQVNKDDIEKYFEPLILVLQKGIEQKIIKNAGFDILKAFIFYPVMMLSNPNHCQDFEASPGNIKTAFTLAWDAIKL